jgi:hypothetical protein
MIIDNFMLLKEVSKIDKVGEGAKYKKNDEG